tara:strand:+ start:10772 stop:14602 length:3831 start_codon:yes stop_codon:yes gene_type:complete
MAVTERLMGTGSFDVSFSQSETPTEVVETIKEWGHIVLTANEVDINTLSDAQILSTARYTGIILNRSLEENVVSITGQGLQLYLGDGSSKGMVIAESKNIGKVRNYIGTTLAETLFNSTAQTNKPLGIMRTEAGNSQAITQGTITNPAGTYTGSHFVQTALSALKEISEQLNTEYKINPDGTIDAGPQANLFQGVNGNPSTIVVKSGYGDDPEFEGVVPQGLRTEFDATDFVSRVDFIGEVGYFDTATDVAGEANLGSNPYKDLHGNALTRVALVQEPDIPIAQLNNRATLMLNELSRVKKVLNLDLQQYEVEGDMRAGDYIFAFDPDIGFKDTATDAAAESRSMYEAVFRGQTITPVKVRVQGLTWPIKQGMGVYFRDKDGNYTDLTQYVTFEAGSAQVELGDLLRFIGDDLRFSEFSLNQVTAGVFSIPDLPATPTLQSGSYQDSVGVDKGFIRVVLAKPTNEDGSQITDGSHYRVRYKKIGDAQYSYKDFPYTGANSESLLLQDLTIGYTYQVGVTVYDKSGFHKMSAYDGTGEDLYTDSSSVNASFATNARVEITKDGVAPSKPHTATIAAGALNVQISHYLRKAGTDGNGNPYGNFTLEGDIDYLAIHAVTVSGNSQNFTVATSNKIGEVRVTAGNLLQQIPVVATIELADSENYYFRIVAVDKSGNASTPSDGQTSAATLIAESHISDATITTAKIGDAQITNAKIADATIDNAKIANLNATKINAGTISADRIGADSITAAKIAANTITATEIAADTITATQIASGTITATEIASGTITTGQLNFTPATSSDLANYVTISSTSAGTLDIVADDVEITGNLSATGTITANAGFISGVAVEPSGVTSAITMDDLSSLISQLTASSGGTFRTASSGARVQISSASSTPIIEFFDSAGSVTGQIGYNSTADKIYMSGSATPINLVTTSAETPAVGNTISRITFSANVLDFENAVGNSRPYIRIGDVTQTNKYLTVDTDGKLAFSSASVTGGVTSITAAGELSLTGAGTGDVTITHADSDHSDLFYTKSTADLLLAAKANSTDIANFVTNANVDTSHGTHGGSSHNTHNYFTNADVDGSHHSHNSYLNVNHNNQVGHHTHNYTVAEDPHGNSEHNASFATNAQVNSAIAVHNAVHHSDKRFKEDIKPSILGLDFIETIKPVDFFWKDDYLEDNIEENNIQNNWKKNQKNVLANVQQGFIAQDLQKAVYDFTGSNTALSAVYKQNFTDKEQDKYKEEELGHVDMVKLVPVLVKSIQELSAKVKLLQARVDEMEEI